jgi:hypothetical protein
MELFLPSAHSRFHVRPQGHDTASMKLANSKSRFLTDERIDVH